MCRKPRLQKCAWPDDPKVCSGEGLPTRIIVSLRTEPELK